MSNKKMEVSLPNTNHQETVMSELKTWQLNLLRSMYLLIVVGLGITTWPSIISPSSVADPHTVIQSILGAFSLLAALGLRYPIQMLPVLLFELLWKITWVVVFALPMWLDRGLDEYATGVLVACVVGIVLTPIVIPWKFVINKYMKSAGDPWTNSQAIKKMA